MALWAFDLETYLITSDNTAPKPVVASWWCGQDAPFLTHPGDDTTLRLLMDPGNHFVGQNIAYDIVVMMRWHPWSIPFWVRALEEGRVWDTQIREQLLHLETKGGHGFPGRISLGDLIQLYLQKDVSADKHGEDIWRLKYGTLDGVPFNRWPTEATRYALDDAVHTWQVFYLQGGVEGRLPTEELQNQAAVVLNASSAWGIYTDQPAAQKHHDELVPEIQRLTQEIEHLGIVGKGSKEKMQDLVAHGWRQLHLQQIEHYCSEWNLGFDRQAFESACAIGDIPKWFLQYHHQQKWQQMPPVIWDANGWNPQEHLEKLMKELTDVPRTKTGFSTGEEQIEPIVEIVPELKTRAELKHLEKMHSTYVTPYLNKRAVHPRFRPVITTGRTACEKPNVQNIPHKYRDVVCPRPGYLYGTIDYSGIEMVTLASTILERYGESKLADAINQGFDLHCLTASSMIGCGYEEMLDKAKKQKLPEWVQYRQGAKAQNFGLPGGLGALAFIAYAKTNYGVLYQYGEAKAIIKKWKKTWPDVDRYLKDNADQVERSHGRVATAINNSGRKKANCIYTELSNYPFQSLAADGGKAALFAIWKDMTLGWWWTDWAPHHGEHPSVAAVAGYGQEFTGSVLRHSHIANFVHDEIMCEHPAALAQEAYNLQEHYMLDRMQAFNPKVKVTVEGHLGREWSH